MVKISSEEIKKGVRWKLLTACLHFLSAASSHHWHTHTYLSRREMGGQTSYLDFLFCTSIRILHIVVDNSSIKSLQSVHVFLLSFLIFFSLHMLKTWYPVLNYFLSLVCNFLRVKSCPTLCDPINCSLPGRLLFPRNFFLGKSTGVGCHFHLQGICPTQGSN